MNLFPLDPITQREKFPLMENGRVNYLYLKKNPWLCAQSL